VWGPEPTWSGDQNTTGPDQNPLSPTQCLLALHLAGVCQPGVCNESIIEQQSILLMLQKEFTNHSEDRKVGRLEVFGLKVFMYDGWGRRQCVIY